MPAWHAFDATHSARVLSQRPGGGGVVALCAAPALAAGPAGPRLALAVVRRWVEEGRQVVLADGHIGRPTLHELVGVENGDGLAELLLAGRSWSELARDGGFDGLEVIPAGGHAAPSAPDAVRERLLGLCESVTGGGRTLALFVPLGSMVAEWAVEVCTDIVVLTGPEESVAHLFAPDEDRVRAVLGPSTAEEGPVPPPVAPSRGGDADPPAPEPAEAREAPPPEIAAPEIAARGPAPPEEVEERWPAEAAPASQEAAVRRRGGRSNEAVVEDSWAQAAARLRARREEDQAGAVAPPVTPPARALESPPEAPLPRTIPEAPPAELGSLAEDVAELPAWLAAESEGDLEGAYTRARRRRGQRSRRWVALAVFLGLTGAAGWLWAALRDRPPLEPTPVMPPRAAVSAPLPAAAGDPAAAEVGSDTPPVAEGAPEDAPVEESAAAPGEAVPAAGQPAPSPGAVVEGADGPLRRFSWALAAMGTYEAAIELADRAGRRAPGTPFAVAPIEVEGRILYRVLGGGEGDRGALQPTRQAVATAAGVAPEGPFVREAPLAFGLGDFREEEEARARAEALRTGGVPAYVLLLEASGGTPVYRVYAGAYASGDEARPLQALLGRAGAGPAPLVERRGRPVR